MIKLISLILFLVSFYTPVVYSETLSGTPNHIFRPLSGKHVEILLERGVFNIGKLNLKKLKKQLQTVEWRMFDEGFLIGSGGNRLTSVYVVEERMVTINTLALKNLEDKPVHVFSWLLHEGLGALGYNDENYELSATISFMADNPQLANYLSIETVEGHFKMLDRSKVGRTYKMSGGSTVVGGGGDAVIIELKQLLLRRYFEWIKISHNKLSKDKINSGFNSLIKFKMETDHREDSDYRNMSFWIEGHTFYVGAGVQFDLVQIYKNENLDLMLDALKEYL